MTSRKLDGEAFTGKVTFMGMETPMEGTLEGGVLKVKYGDMDMSFAKEARARLRNSNARR